MGKTSIEWTEFSTNPIRARHGVTNRVGHYCQKISPGCRNCYSSALQRRFGTPPFHEEHREDMQVFLDETKLHDVIARKKPTTYFWADMTDLFGSWVPDRWIDACFAAMMLSPQHTHQILTKRPERMARYCGLTQAGAEDRYLAISEAARALTFNLPHGGPIGQGRWPLPNVWAGTSIENQDAANERIPWLLKTPAAVRFISYEPALGPIDLSSWLPRANVCQTRTQTPASQAALRTLIHTAAKRLGPVIDWLIAGAESGPNARPMNEEWVRAVRDQCQAAGVAFFYKQKLDERGRKIALPLLDGRQWKEFPGGQP